VGVRGAVDEPAVTGSDIDHHASVVRRSVRAERGEPLTLDDLHGGHGNRARHRGATD
jgi:hypothetical protein